MWYSVVQSSTVCKIYALSFLSQMHRYFIDKKLFFPYLNQSNLISFSIDFNFNHVI